VYEDSQIEIQSGDVMVAFTDGLTECENANGERFTERRLRTVVQKASATGAAGVCNAVVEAVTGFRGAQPPSDDITLVATSVD
jgi:sigma-B regulation protein RsbU (phosphoserine phosphatase)